MITQEENTRLHTALSGMMTGSRGSYRADMIEVIYSMTLELTDNDDLYQAAEELVTLAGYIRDEASAACETAQHDYEDGRADLAYDERKCDVGDLT